MMEGSEDRGAKFDAEYRLATIQMAISVTLVIACSFSITLADQFVNNGPSPAPVGPIILVSLIVAVRKRRIDRIRLRLQFIETGQVRRMSMSWPLFACTAMILLAVGGLGTGMLLRHTRILHEMRDQRASSSVARSD